MKFLMWVPCKMEVDSERLLELAEHVNKRLNRPLQRAVWSEDLFEQAILEGIIPPPPPGSHVDGNQARSYSRDKLLRIRDAGRRRAAKGT